MSTAFINLRDLGGMPSQDGRTLQSGRLLRAGQPHTMGTEITGTADLELVIDLRYAMERELNPVPWPATFVGRTLAHGLEQQAEAPHVQAERQGGGRTAIQAFYRDMYATLPLTEPYGNLFATALQEMSSVRGSTLIHCTAGKDRTGMLVALALHALCVEREAIIQDFLATRAAAGMELLRAELESRVDASSSRHYSDDVVDELLDVRADYLEIMFSAISDQHGATESFFDSLGLTSERRTAWRDAVLL